MDYNTLELENILISKKNLLSLILKDVKLPVKKKNIYFSWESYIFTFFLSFDI